MNDPLLPPPSPDDEVVSAYLDGEATDAEIARVEASPELLARVEEFRALDARIAATPATATDERRDAMIAAALAASSTSPKVSSIETARSKRQPFYTRPLVAVAAVLLLALVATPILLRSGDSDVGDAATSASDDGGEAFDEAAGDDGSDDGAAMEEAAPQAAADAESAETSPAADDPDAAGAAMSEDDGSAEGDGSAEDGDAMAEDDAMSEDDGGAADDDAPADSTVPTAPLAQPDGPIDLGEFDDLDSLITAYDDLVTRNFAFDTSARLKGANSDTAFGALEDGFCPDIDRALITATAAVGDARLWVIDGPDAEALFFDIDTCLPFAP